MIHWSSGREGHNNYRRDLVIWLVHLIYSAVGFALCYNYVILNYTGMYTSIHQLIRH